MDRHVQNQARETRATALRRSGALHATEQRPSCVERWFEKTIFTTNQTRQMDVQVFVGLVVFHQRPPPSHRLHSSRVGRASNGIERGPWWER